MNIETGFFFISDITGYTRFLTQSELGHAKEILDAVFDSIVEHIEAPLSVSKVEGDAVFCYVPADLLKQPGSMINAMQATYFEFQRQLRLMDINTTCDCNACVNMTELDLKVFIHHGEYIVHDVAGSSELAGSDVILVHRLMKNSVNDATGLTGYGLITEAALEAIGTTGEAEGMTRHVENYEDFGDVTVYLADLAAAWRAQVERQRAVVKREDAIAYADAFLPVTPWIAWNYANDSEVKKQMFGVESHERTDGAAGLGIGSSFHCKHELGTIDYLVIDMDAPNYFTNSNRTGPVATLTTTRFVPVEGGVQAQFLAALVDDGGDQDAVAARMQAAADRSARVLTEVIAADLEAGMISREAMASASSGKQEARRPEVALGRFGVLGDLDAIEPT
ncbi:MAG: DUF2652 domain-containing protein [Acidimicrobiia bacterium]|nr:DUF2652 domain-containing protein [Acidimicrobiia bacterium]